VAAVHAAVILQSPTSTSSLPLNGVPLLSQGSSTRVLSKGARGPVYGLSWAPDGKALASSGYQQVNLWSPDSDVLLRTYSLHTDLVRDVAWSADGVLMASAGQDGTVRVWNAETLLPAVTLQTGPARAVKWSPDGRRLATGSESGVLQIWQAPRGELLHTARIQTTISSVSWSPDGSRVAVGGINGLTTLWDADTGKLLRKTYVSWPERNDVNGVTWSPHGIIVAAAHGARGAGGLRFWNAATGTVVQSLASPAGWLRGLSWSPDGRWVAAGGEDGVVRIWNVDTAEIATTLATDSRPVWSVAWSPDGSRLAAGNNGPPGSGMTGGSVSIWATPVAVFGGEAASVYARAVEASLLKRTGNAALDISRPASPATEFRDGGAYGTLIRFEPPFGNLEASFLESDLRSLGIDVQERFDVRCRETTMTVILGSTWGDVPPREWVGYFSLEGVLIIARNSASAAEASGCQPGDRLFIARHLRER
jgi:WD40 repeat protein